MQRASVLVRLTHMTELTSFWSSASAPGARTRRSVLPEIASLHNSTHPSEWCLSLNRLFWPQRKNTTMVLHLPRHIHKCWTSVDANRVAML